MRSNWKRFTACLLAMVFTGTGFTNTGIALVLAAQPEEEIVVGDSLEVDENTSADKGSGDSENADNHLEEAPVGSDYNYEDAIFARYSMESLSSAAAGAKIEDESGKSNDAYIRGEGAQVRIGSLGLPGGAAGSNAAYVELPEGMFDGQDKLTVSVWLQNTTGVGNYAGMYFGQKASTGGMPTLYWLLNPSVINTGCFKSVMTKSANAGAPYSTETAASSTKTAASWQMYTTVIEDHKITGYLDGQKVSEDSSSTLSVSDFGSSLVAYIGRSEYNDKFYSGGVKDVRIYATPLNGTEIMELYEKTAADTEKKTSDLRVSSVETDTIEPVEVQELEDHPISTNAVVHFSDGSKKEDAHIIWTNPDTGKQVTNTKDFEPGTYTLKGSLSYFGNPLIEERADPYITYDDESGYYYFTSSWPAYGSVNDGYDRISIRRSKTLEGLADAEENVVWEAHESGEQSAHIWAPELHKINGKWYLYYAANSDSGVWSIRCYVLECAGSDPTDPSAWSEKGRFTDKDGGYAGCFDAFSLDMTYFKNNGKDYVIWAYKSGSSVLKMAELDSASPWKLAGEPITLSVPEYDWEMVNEWVNEGPAVLVRDGNIYVAYSAAATGDEYCMGMLTASADADLMDVNSWTKSPVPVLATDDFTNQYGPGHNSFTVDADGNVILVYHSRDQECHDNKCAYANKDPLYDPCRNANLAYVRFAQDGTPVFTSTEAKEYAGYDSYEMTVTVQEREAQAVLIADYPLRQTGGDASGNGYDGILTGSHISFEDGMILQGPAGDIGQNYLDLSSNAALLDAVEAGNNLTVTAWVRNDTTGNTKNTVFAFGKDENNFYAFNTLNWGNPRSAFVVDGTESGFNYAAAGTEASVTGEWYPVAIVLREASSGTSIRYYMNDELVLNVTSAYTIADLGDLSFFRIGGGVNANYYDMAGGIRDVRIYDQALNAAAIKEHNEANSVSAAKEQLAIPEADNVLGNITLSENGKFGTSITWESSDPSVISDQDKGRYKAGVVSRQAEDVKVTLTATITRGSTSDTKQIPVTVRAAAQQKEYEAYLFAYFTGEGSAKGEQIYFAGSKDGLNWRALNSGDPVLESSMGDKGLRDPYIIRSPEGDKFYLIATDLKIYGNGNWGAAQNAGSRYIMVWESTDLVNWSDQRMVEVAADNAGCTWAPEAFYDEETGEYIVFWASKTSDDNYGTHQIYYCTTRDFYTFSEPQVWISLYNKDGDRISVIDTSVIAVTGDDGKKTYYRISKNEAGSNASMEEGDPASGKYTYLETSDSLTGTWTRIPSSYLSSTQWVEGGTFFQFNNEEKWCLLLDDFGGGGYFPSITDNIGSGNFTRLEADQYSFPSTMRHGTVIGVSAEEYEALQEKWGVFADDPDVPIEDARLAYFSFDDMESGLSGNGATAVPSSDVSFTSDAVSGNALMLNSASKEWLNVTKEDGTSLLTGYDTLTIQYYSKGTETGNGWAAYAAPDTSAPVYAAEKYLGIIDTASLVEAQRYHNSGGRPVSPQVTENNTGWKMVTVVIEPGKTKIYIDGEWKAEQESAYSLSDILGRKSVLQIGKANWAGGEYFNGSIDELSIYGRALSAGEIAYLAGAESIPAERIVVQTDKSPVYTGETAQMTAKIYPLVATERDVTWSVSDETIAEISTEGLLTAKQEGSVTVTAEAADGSGVSGNLVVAIAAQQKPDENPDEKPDENPDENPDEKPDEKPDETHPYKILLQGENLTLKKDSYVYTGSQVIPALTVKYGTKKLKLNVDYTVKYSDNVNVGTAGVTVKGMGDYTGSISKTFTITPKDMKNAAIQEIGDCVYTGNPAAPAVVVLDGNRVLTEGKDFTAEYTPGLTGSAEKDTVVTVKVSGIGNYTGAAKKTRTFTILSSQDTVDFSDASKVKVVFKDSKDETPGRTYTYNGKVQKPAVLVTDMQTGKKIPAKQYKIIYNKCVDAGTAAVTVVGKNGYAGAQTLTFAIEKKELSKVKIAKLPSVTYDGDLLKGLTLTVKDGKKVLREGADYTASYRNLNMISKKTQKASVVLTAAEGSNYKGTSKEIGFQIVQRLLSNKNAVKVVVAEASVNADGSAVTPAAVVTYNGEVLTENVDYVLKFSNNRKATTKAKVTVTAVKGGLYKGKTTAKFTIK